MTGSAGRVGDEPGHRGTYPAMVEIWRRAWTEFTPFLEFPLELREIVYTTNAIESLNARLRKAVRRRGHFPNEQAALNVLYLAAKQRQHNRTNPTGETAGWKSILNVDPRVLSHGRVGVAEPVCGRRTPDPGIR